jgi:hypothetical protein
MGREEDIGTMLKDFSNAPLEHAVKMEMAANVVTINSRKRLFSIRIAPLGKETGSSSIAIIA